MKPMIIGERPTYATGFGVVLANLLRFGNYKIPPDVVSPVSTLWHELPTDMGLFTQYCVTGTSGDIYFLKKLKPDVLVGIGSFPHVHTLIETAEHGKKNGINIPVVAYVATENPPIPKDIITKLNKVDLVLTPSKFSKDMFEDANLLTRVEVVRHGVDTEVFGQLAIEKEHDFLYYGDNNIRKQIPRLFQSFKKLLDKNPDLSLMLSTDPQGRGSRLGENLFTVADALKLDIEKNIRFSKESGNCPQLSFETVNMINASKILVIPSAGESFCLPGLEAAACGVPSIVTDYTGLKEFMGDTILYADSVTELWFQWGFLRIVDVDDLADKMYDLLTDEKKYKRYSEKCYKRAQELTWNEPAELFKKYLEELTKKE